MRDFHPLSNRTLIRVLDDGGEEKTDAGVIIPDTDPDNQIYTGVVEEVGDGRYRHGSREEMALEEGDRVFFSEHVGQDVPLGDDDKRYLVVREHNVMGKYVE